VAGITPNPRYQRRATQLSRGILPAKSPQKAMHGLFLTMPANLRKKGL